MKIDDRNVYMPARYTVTVAGISRRKHKNNNMEVKQ